MASLLRQIVAGPRARHPEANLDLCYVSENIIATSGPSSTYPKRAYRNPTDALVRFLDAKHGDQWCVFEFRAEGTGYPDSEVYGRIRHFPWPDHHPPPFGLLPGLMAAMREWLKEGGSVGEMSTSPDEKNKRVAVVHCKAGKGRSGTCATSYLISEEGWKMEDALKRFTERRMRVGFGNGVSIPSQVRWVKYVDQWTNQLQKKYVERRVEIVEVHVWGLRDGVKVAVEGFVEDGRKIQCFHIFKKEERTLVDDGKGSASSAVVGTPVSTTSNTGTPVSSSSTPSASEAGTPMVSTPLSSSAALNRQSLAHTSTFASSASKATTSTTSPSAPVAISAAILKPATPLILPTSDINIDLERRNKASYTGFTMVTSLAHVWFNAWFEGGHDGNDSGVFEINWEAMDGIKGSARKGTKALERLAVVWRYVDAPEKGVEVPEPAPGTKVADRKPADWHGEDESEIVGTAVTADDGEDTIIAPLTSQGSDPAKEGKRKSAGVALTAAALDAKRYVQKELGLRKETPESADVSRAGTIREPSPGPTPMQAAEEGAEVQGAELKKDSILAEVGDDGTHGVKSHHLTSSDEALANEHVTVTDVQKPMDDDTTTAAVTAPAPSKEQTPTMAEDSTIPETTTATTPAENTETQKPDTTADENTSAFGNLGLARVAGIVSNLAGGGGSSTKPEGKSTAESESAKENQLANGSGDGIVDSKL